ncbi:hypothetical protein ABZ027_28055 [Streptomyces sp. NPDC006332]|uniref:hypothetical protein n=1 Tax=Streptomyces sp. NPDC006332 TaxID=3155456 RepID=UPI0033AE8E76
MARHTSSQNPTARQALAALATAGVALGAGATTASAATDTTHYEPTSPGHVDPQAGLQPPTGTVGHVTGPVAGLKANPLAGTGVDPLDNGVGTQVADFKPLSSRAVTGPVTQAESVGSLPVAGQAVGVLGR